MISDANEFKNKFPDSQKTFLLTKDEVVKAGFVINGTDTESLEFIQKEELGMLTTQINAGDIDMEDNYKIFVADYQMFEEPLNEGITFEGLDFDKELSDEVFDSEDPLTVIAKSANEENWKPVRDVLAEDLGSATQTKGALFAVLMLQGLSEGPTYIIENLKSDNLEVYPESPLFIALEVIPESLYDKIAGGEDNEMEVLAEG